jgi:hypothetical protein
MPGHTTCPFCFEVIEGNQRIVKDHVMDHHGRLTIDTTDAVWGPILYFGDSSQRFIGTGEKDSVDNGTACVYTVVFPSDLSALTLKDGVLFKLRNTDNELLACHYFKYASNNPNNMKTIFEIEDYRKVTVVTQDRPDDEDTL